METQTPDRNLAKRCLEKKSHFFGELRNPVGVGDVSLGTGS